MFNTTPIVIPFTTQIAPLVAKFASESTIPILTSTIVLTEILPSTSIETPP